MLVSLYLFTACHCSYFRFTSILERYSSLVPKSTRTNNTQTNPFSCQSAICFAITWSARESLLGIGASVDAANKPACKTDQVPDRSNWNNNKLDMHRCIGSRVFVDSTSSSRDRVRLILVVGRAADDGRIICD